MDDQESELLHGKCLKIYWYLLTHNASGVREIQRHLKIPSPSTVSYHLNKLIEEVLVEKKTDDKFTIDSPTKNGIMCLYIKIGTKMIPRMIFYLSFFFVGMIFYVIIIFTRSEFTVHLEDFLFLFFLCSGTAFFGYEAIRIWTMKPF